MASGGGPSESYGEVSPRPKLSADFARHVLDQLPTAVIVVDRFGDVIYGNTAMQALGGWSDRDFGTNIIQQLHPDDAPWVAAAFLSLANDGGAHLERGRTTWAAVHFRMVASDGRDIPIEVSGSGALHDPHVGGIVYSVRPSYMDQILSDVLTGIASGTSIERLLGNVLDMVAAPPLDLEAAIVRPTTAGDYELMATTSPKLAAALDGVVDPTPWAEASSEVAFVPIAGLGDALGTDLADAGFSDLWHVAVESRMTSSTFRIIACSPTHHVPATGVINRLQRAQELAAAVLLRSQTDVLLAHAAFHDHLTQLTNRAGLMNRFDELGARPDHVLIVLYIDLDNFKPINDVYGHDAGDRVLQVTADRLLEASRSNDIVARIGGDEFVIVLGSTTDRLTAGERAEATAARLVETIGQPIDMYEGTVRVSASVGAVISESDATINQLIARADRAMFEAKRAGGDRGHLAGA